MAQIPRTVNDIINNAFYLLGEVSPDVVPSSSMVNQGLFVLNNMLDSFSAEGVFIPTIKEIDVTLVPNQQVYVVSNIVPADFNFNRIVELDFVVIRQQNIDYPIRVVDRSVILNNIRYPTLIGMPDKVYLDRLELQSNLTFYPTPSLAFSCRILAKFMLDSFELFQVITEVPPSMFEFLIYGLARQLSAYYPSSTWKTSSFAFSVQEEQYQTTLQRLKGGNSVNLLIDPDYILLSPFRHGYYDRFGII
jgi:hypothetical protein